MRKTLLVVVTLALALAPATARSAPRSAFAAEIEKKATLVEGGAAVLVRIAVTCPAGSEVLESFVYVVQDGNTSNFAPVPVACDSTSRTYTVRVNATDFRFERGKARASGYVLLASGESVSPTRVIKIR